MEQESWHKVTRVKWKSHGGEAHGEVVEKQIGAVRWAFAGFLRDLDRA